MARGNRNVGKLACRGRERVANRAHFRRAYGDRAAGDSSASAVHYNFGTTLLELGSPAAPSQLDRVSESRDSELRREALYNLGLWNLRRARDVSSADSVLAYATAAAGANKEALRLEPGRPDARRRPPPEAASRRRVAADMSFLSAG